MSQNNWKWCTKCQGLFFAGNGNVSVCPAGGNHSEAGSGDYTLVLSPRDQIQNNWKWCTKCQGLFFAGNGPGPGAGVCPAGDKHSDVGSGDYTLVNINPPSSRSP